AVGLSDPRERDAHSGIGTDDGRDSAFAADAMTEMQAGAQAGGRQVSQASEPVRRIQRGKRKMAASHAHPSGINAKAKAVWIDGKATDESKTQYESIKDAIVLQTRKLTHAIEKTLQHKRTAPRSRMMSGRLGKNLLHMVTEEQPRLFYKKAEP